MTPILNKIVSSLHAVSRKRGFGTDLLNIEWRPEKCRNRNVVWLPNQKSSLGGLGVKCVVDDPFTPTTCSVPQPLKRETLVLRITPILSSFPLHYLLMPVM